MNFQVRVRLSGLGVLMLRGGERESPARAEILFTKADGHAPKLLVRAVNVNDLNGGFKRLNPLQVVDADGAHYGLVDLTGKIVRFHLSDVGELAIPEKCDVTFAPPGGQKPQSSDEEVLIDWIPDIGWLGAETIAYSNGGLLAAYNCRLFLPAVTCHASRVLRRSDGTYSVFKFEDGNRRAIADDLEVIFDDAAVAVVTVTDPVTGASESFALQPFEAGKPVALSVVNDTESLRWTAGQAGSLHHLKMLEGIVTAGEIKVPEEVDDDMRTADPICNLVRSWRA